MTGAEAAATHTVVVHGVKSFDSVRIDGVTRQDIDRWLSVGYLVHEGRIRPMATIAEIIIDPDE